MVKKQRRGKPKHDNLQPKVKAVKHGSKEAAGAFFRQWQERNEGSIADYNALRSEANLGKANAYNAKARAISLNALPRWADLKTIEQKYVDAARLGLVVDHVVPLKGNFVCGLHVEENLELLSQEANLRKGNRFDDDS
jgi:hypothetical protein